MKFKHAHTPSLHLLVLSCLIALTSMACRPVVRVTDQVFFGGKVADNEETLGKLDAELAKLKSDYAQAVITLNADIAKHKSTINAHIEASEIGPALEAIKVMDRDLHEGPYVVESKRHRIVIKEDLNQRSYILDASKRTLVAVDAVIQSGDFQRLDTWLAARKNLPADEATLKEFSQKHDQLYTLWVEFLKKEMTRTQGAYPGSALIYGLKARALAQQIKDTQSVESLELAIDILRDGLIEQHGYVLSMGSANGPNSDAVARALLKHEWGARHMKLSSSPGARVDGVISFTISAPSYKRSTSERTDSFTYQSGTRQVANPALADAQGRVKSLQKDLDGLRDRRSTKQSNLSRVSNPDSLQRDIDNLDKTITKKESEVSGAQDKLSSIPPTITQPVMDTYTYPVKVHHMNAELALSASASASNGASDTRKGGDVSAHLTDDEHAAHSMKDGSVSADQANPPTQSQALSALLDNTTGALVSLSVEAFTAHRDRKIASLPDGRDAQIHALAIYILLDPGTASPEAIEQIEEVAEFKGIKALMMP